MIKHIRGLYHRVFGRKKPLVPGPIQIAPLSMDDLAGLEERFSVTAKGEGALAGASAVRQASKKVPAKRKAPAKKATAKRKSTRKKA